MKRVCCAAVAVLVIGSSEAIIHASPTSNSASAGTDLDLGLRARIEQQQLIVEHQRAAIAHKDDLIDSANQQLMRALDALEASNSSNQELRTRLQNQAMFYRQLEIERDLYRDAVGNLEREADQLRQLTSSIEAENARLKFRLTNQETVTVQAPKRDSLGRAIVTP